MARYRGKSEDDLVWNRIRRQITRDIDTEIQNRREKVLDIALTEAWKEFTAAVQTGELKEVEAKYSSLVTTIVGDIVPERGHALEVG